MYEDAPTVKSVPSISISAEGPERKLLITLVRTRDVTLGESSVTKYVFALVKLNSRRDLRNRIRGTFKFR